MRKLLLLVCMTLCILQAWAQNRTISGTVTDEKGNPLGQISVFVKGTQKGTSTKADGTFSLSVPTSAKSLVFSAVGFRNDESSIEKTSTLNVTLIATTQKLDEVVVVAYGQQQKKAVTGAISSVTADKIARQQVVSATQALQGLAAGVLVINSTGQPGDNPVIRIRGIGSVNASADPLFVVDGIPFNGNINTINPNDIESMNVLKDATATSLYGSRAANGVILVTTKKGKRGGDPNINVYSSFGVSSRAVKEFDFLSPEQYMKMAWEAQKNYATDNNIANPGQYASDNLITGSANSYGLKYNPYNVAKPIDANGNLVSGASLLWNTDWTKEVANSTIQRKNVGIGISGGSEKMRYYLSGDYLNQDGYVINSNYKRFTVRFNGDADLKSWLTVGLNTSVSSSDQNYPDQSGSAFRNAVQFGRIMSSIYPLYMRDDNGALLLNAAGQQQYDFGGPQTGRTVNVNRPVAQNMNAVAIQSLDNNLNNRLQTSVNTYGEVKFTKTLRFKSAFGIDRYVYGQSIYQNPTYGDAASIGGRVTKERDMTTSWTWNNMLAYQESFGKHTLGAMASTEAYDYKYESLVAATTGFPLPGLQELGPGATKERASSGTDRTRLVSYLARATYNYDNKYFFEGTVRTDGSSRFLPAKRWGVFYAVGGSWIVSSESFMKSQKIFDQLKLRASYGEVGNNALTSYFPYLSAFSTGYNDLSNPGVYLTGLGNTNITWEKLGTYNIGVDFSVLKGRLTGSLEYYNKNTFDLLFSRPLPPSSGVTSISDNVGTVKNSGIELTLNSRNVVTKNFTWETNFNLATVKNRITKLPQQFITSGSFRMEVGQSLQTFYIYEWAGVNTQNGKPQWNADEMSSGTATGKTVLVNSIASTATAVARRSYQGTAIPKVTGGFGNTLTYKNFDFSFLMNFAFGSKVLDQDWIGLMHGFSSVGNQLSTDILNRWTTPGQVTDVPRLQFGSNDYGNASSRQLFSGDYVRLRNVTLGYNLPQSLVAKTNNVVKSFRLYVAADNYLTWSKLKKGTDPELNLNGTSGQSSSPFKTFSVGLTAGF